eukprot:9063367-Prorocentrum_lima.AAC.1
MCIRDRGNFRKALRGGCSVREGDLRENREVVADQRQVQDVVAPAGETIGAVDEVPLRSGEVDIVL